MNEAFIGALSTAFVLLLGAGVAAWISLKKSRDEAKKTNRNGVLEEWREIVGRLQATVDAQGLKISALETELSALRTQIDKRDTERIEQRTRVDKLTDAVGDKMDKSGPDAMADLIVPKIVEAMKADKDTKGNT